MKRKLTLDDIFDDDDFGLLDPKVKIRAKNILVRFENGGAKYGSL